MRALLPLLLMVTGCATTPRAPTLDPISLAQSMTGCWVGQRSDGRMEVLRIEQREWGLELLSAAGEATCIKAVPLFYSVTLERKDNEVVAYSRLPAQFYAWTVSATPDTVLFTPANAPVWMRLKRLDERRIEWSLANYTDAGTPYADATILTRTEPMP